MRSSRFAERGWVSQLDPDELTPTRLAETIIETLSTERQVHPVAGPDLGGLARAVEHLHAAALFARAENIAPQSASVPSALTS
jgi:predicted glycosyltransferase